MDNVMPMNFIEEGLFNRLYSEIKILNDARSKLIKAHQFN